MVVLPAPFGPSRATTSPSAASSHTSRISEPRATTMWARNCHVARSPPPNHLSRRATRTAKETATISNASDDAVLRVGVESEVDREREASVSCPGSCRRR